MTTNKQLWILLLSIASLAYAVAQEDNSTVASDVRNGKGKYSPNGS
jgi:hypothetical protein